VRLGAAEFGGDDDFLGEFAEKLATFQRADFPAFLFPLGAHAGSFLAACRSARQAVMILLAMKLLPFVCLAMLCAVPARAVELSLVRTNLAIPVNRALQVPVTASDPSGGPLTFSIVSIKPKALIGRFTPATNRSLVL